MTSFRSRLFYTSSIFIAAAMAMMSSGANAQAETTAKAFGTADVQASDAMSQRSEIVVTGLSRNQKLQSAPATVTVFTESKIRDANIQKVDDFIALTPNVSLARSESSGVNFITIRGITQVRNSQSPIAVIVDGVQQMDPRQFTQDLSDLAQVEVLSGPQGDLWGRNAIGGAIVLRTREPTNELKVLENLIVGNGQNYDEKLAVSGPIVRDRLFYDVNGSYNYYGGQLENVYLHKTVDRQRDYAAHGHIKAVITDDLTADLRAGYTRSTGGGSNYHYQGAKYDPANPCFLDLSNPFGGPAPDANNVNRTFCANNRGEDQRTMIEASGVITYTGAIATVTNTFGYAKITEFTASDQYPYTASRDVLGVEGTQSRYQQSRSWEDELRITSNAAGRFHWMAGGSLYQFKDYYGLATGRDLGHGIAHVTTSPQFNNAENPTVTFFGNRDKNWNYALFAHAGYDLTSKLTVEAGMRYDWNNLTQYVDAQSTSGAPTGCSLATNFEGACIRKKSFNGAQPKVTLTYRPVNNVTLFTSYSLGFRTGAFNQSGTSALVNLPGVTDTVNAERAYAVEAGFKSQWFDHRLTLNASFFHTIDKNALNYQYLGAVNAQLLFNINKVELIGGEFLVNYALSDKVDLFATGGYTHSKIKAYDFDPSTRGNWAPYVPIVTGDAGFQVRHELTGATNLFGRFDVEVHGKQYWDPNNTTARSTFALVNLQAGIEGANKRWRVIGFVSNLSDKAYNSEFVAGGFALPATPRRFGVRLGFDL